MENLWRAASLNDRRVHFVSNEAHVVDAVAVVYMRREKTRRIMRWRAPGDLGVEIGLHPSAVLWSNVDKRLNGQGRNLTRGQRTSLCFYLLFIAVFFSAVSFFNLAQCVWKGRSSIMNFFVSRTFWVSRDLWSSCTLELIGGLKKNPGSWSGGRGGGGSFEWTHPRPGDPLGATHFLTFTVLGEYLNLSTSAV